MHHSKKVFSLTRSQACETLLRVYRPGEKQSRNAELKSIIIIFTGLTVENRQYVRAVQVREGQMKKS